MLAERSPGSMFSLCSLMRPDSKFTPFHSDRTAMDSTNSEVAMTEHVANCGNVEHVTPLTFDIDARRWLASLAGFIGCLQLGLWVSSRCSALLLLQNQRHEKIRTFNFNNFNSFLSCSILFHLVPLVTLVVLASH